MTVQLLGGRRLLAVLLPCSSLLLAVGARAQDQRPRILREPGRAPGKVQVPPIGRTPIDPARLRPRSPLYFYKLGGSNLTPGMFRTAGDQFKTKLGEQNGGYFLQDASGPRGMLDLKGGQMVVVPDLSTARAAPNAAVASRLSSGFVEQLGLVPKDDAGLKVRDIATWTKQSGAPGKADAPQDCIRTTNFSRVISDLDVFGPNSVLNVSVGARGVEGVTSTLRALQKTDTEVKLRSDAEINDDFNRQLAEQTRSFQGAKPVVGNRQLVYLEQGMQYAQPVYRYDVVFQSDVGTQAANSIFVQAASNSPERLMDMNMGGDQPEGLRRVSGPRPQTQTRPVDFRTGEMRAGQDNPKLQQTQAGGVQVGLYIVREDHECWKNDADAFMTNLNALNWLLGKPKKAKRDYMWDYPQYWHKTDTNADSSRYFAGKDNMALIEGHGAPWLVTTYKNYGDVIHANQLKGFGANAGAGLNEITNYIIWQGCDIIPAPGDGYGGDYSSGSPFDVWWGVFKGMRGVYGYHTTMGICNQVGGGFGLRIGMGVPNLASWLSTTAGNPQGHPDGWNYGAAVIVTGHENDTLYDTSPLSNPSQLTIWWNHP